MVPRMARRIPYLRRRGTRRDHSGATRLIENGTVPDLKVTLRIKMIACSPVEVLAVSCAARHNGRHLTNGNIHVMSSISRLTPCHPWLYSAPSRPSRGALMRRREGGAGPAPAGVVRSCTPGRTPEEPRQLLRAGLGPGTVERESGKSRWRAGQARSFFWRLLWRATPPHF